MSPANETFIRFTHLETLGALVSWLQDIATTTQILTVVLNMSDISSNNRGLSVNQRTTNSPDMDASLACICYFDRYQRTRTNKGSRNRFSHAQIKSLDQQNRTKTGPHDHKSQVERSHFSCATAFNPSTLHNVSWLPRCTLSSTFSRTTPAESIGCRAELTPEERWHTQRQCSLFPNAFSHLKNHPTHASDTPELSHLTNQAHPLQVRSTV